MFRFKSVQLWERESHCETAGCYQLGPLITVLFERRGTNFPRKSSSFVSETASDMSNFRHFLEKLLSTFSSHVITKKNRWNKNWLETPLINHSWEDLLFGLSKETPLIISNKSLSDRNYKCYPDRKALINQSVSTCPYK